MTASPSHFPYILYQRSSTLSLKLQRPTLTLSQLGKMKCIVSTHPEKTEGLWVHRGYRKQLQPQETTGGQSAGPLAGNILSVLVLSKQDVSSVQK